MPTLPSPHEGRTRADALVIAREIETLATAIQAEALRANCSRAFLETYSARLLKAAARLYAATLPPAPPTQRPLTVTEAALLHTFQGERHAA